MVFTFLQASSEAPVLPEHIKHPSFEIGYSGDALEMDESNPNPSQTFKMSALCKIVALNPVVTSIQMCFHPFVNTKGPCNTLSQRVKLLILHDVGTPMSPGLSFPLLYVLDLTRTCWIII